MVRPMPHCRHDGQLDAGPLEHRSGFIGDGIIGDSGGYAIELAQDEARSGLELGRLREHHEFVRLPDQLLFCLGVRPSSPRRLAIRLLTR